MPSHPAWSVGAWRSLVARVVRDDEVGGSNPLAPTKLSNRAAELEDGGQGRCQVEFDRGGRKFVDQLFESQHLGPSEHSSGKDLACRSSRSRRSSGNSEGGTRSAHEGIMMSHRPETVTATRRAWDTVTGDEPRTDPGTPARAGDGSARFADVLPL